MNSALEVSLSQPTLKIGLLSFCQFLSFEGLHRSADIDFTSILLIQLGSNDDELKVNFGLCDG
jgi:hypothetical protein